MSAELKPPASHLPDDAFVRESYLANKGDRVGVVGVSKAQLWRWVRSGVFPKPTKLSEGVTAWRWGEVRTWLQSRTAT